MNRAYVNVNDAKTPRLNNRCKQFGSAFALLHIAYYLAERKVNSFIVIDYSIFKGVV